MKSTAMSERGIGIGDGLRFQADQAFGWRCWLGFEYQPQSHRNDQARQNPYATFAGPTQPAHSVVPVGVFVAGQVFLVQGLVDLNRHFQK